MKLSVLFVTYNRAHLLHKTVHHLRTVLDESGIEYEIVVADDCSNKENCKLIDSLANVRVIRTIKNSGLGANCNNGIKACLNDYILQVQDDWLVTSGPGSFVQALKYFELFPILGILQLNEVYCDVGFSKTKVDSSELYLYKNDHLPWKRKCDLRPYSDQPHIKRKKFHFDMGGYLENAPMTMCELDFKMRVANQSSWRVGMVSYAPMFEHIGVSESLNPGASSNSFVSLIKSIPIVGIGFERIIRKTFYAAENCIAIVSTIIFDRSK